MEFRSRWSAGLVLILGSLLAGCGTPGPKTEIVREVESAGGGNASTVSPEALRHWFFLHRNFATHISNECASSAEAVKLGYTDTTEGKVCAAAYDMRAQRARRDGIGF